MTYDILIRNSTILPMTSGTSGVLEKGYIRIKDGVIEKVGQGTPAESSANAEVVIDASSKIVMPGLVNCHTHLPMSMFRGLADDLPLDVWLNEHIFPAEAEHVNPESVKRFSEHSVNEMLLSGTTCCCDGYFLEQSVAEAVIESGIRAVLGHGVIDFPAPGVPDPAENVDAAVKFAGDLAGRFSRVHPSIFCHSPYTCSEKTLVKAKQAADEPGILFQIHAAETERENEWVGGNTDRSVVAYLDRIGVLDEKTLLVHSVWVDDADLKIIRDRGCPVAHCAQSNMKLASGIAPVPAMLAAGITIGMGTDGCASNNNHDLFEEMDTAAKLHKCANSDPCVTSAETVVKMATIEGAKALGIADITGSLEEGKRADIILVDTERPHLVPAYNPFSLIAYAARGSDVTDVIVDGIIRVKDSALQP
ncbi:MAG: amidohydrolase [Desulfarculaceae bacterium]|nr:amidohydrolase [Desulfarculaceae bacterium]